MHLLAQLQMACSQPEVSFYRSCPCSNQLGCLKGNIWTTLVLQGTTPDAETETVSTRALSCLVSVHWVNEIGCAEKLAAWVGSPLNFPHGINKVYIYLSISIYHLNLVA